MLPQMVDGTGTSSGLVSGPPASASGNTWIERNGQICKGYLIKRALKVLRSLQPFPFNTPERTESSIVILTSSPSATSSGSNYANPVAGVALSSHQ